MPPEPQAGWMMLRSRARGLRSGEEADDEGLDAELAAVLALGAVELAEEVLVDAPEGVVVHGGGNLRDAFEQLLEECW